MEIEAATALGKYIGAGVACIGMAGAAIGVGNAANGYLSGALRNPAAADQQRGNFFVGMALAEAMGLFAFVIAAVLAFT